MSVLDYFDQQIKVTLRGQHFNVYLTPPKSGPLIVLHHGMGSSAATFAVLARQLQETMKEDGPGVLTFDARFHGQTYPEDVNEKPNFDSAVLADDCEAIVKKVVQDLQFTGPLLVVGHSMGGTVVSLLCSQKRLPNVCGLTVLDAVEGYALGALTSMPSLVSTWPQSFDSLEDAVKWSLSTHQVRNKESVEISVPGMLRHNEKDGKYYWAVDLLATRPFWESWFKDLDANFLKSPVSRLLILAGTGRLDKELMVGQMQGKYQLVVFNDSGHFIQEDHPKKTALVIQDFWTRNQKPLNIVPKFGTFRKD